MGWIDRAYRVMVNGQGDTPADFPEQAERAAPRNFFVYVGSHLLTKIGDAVASPKTTLTWLAGALAVPGWMVGMLVPLRESGSMLVQIWLATMVQRFARRKRAWSLGALLQGLAMLGIALAALHWRGSAAGVVLLVGLAVFALARSISSVASKDVLARTQPRRRRGQATGWAASAAGTVTLAAGAAAALWAPGSLPAVAYAWLVGAAALLWLLAAALFLSIDEPAQDTAKRDSGARLRLLWQDALLRRFVLARALFLCTALSAPFYVLLAQHAQGSAPRVLAGFILAEGLAGMLGGPVWGRLADHSSRRVMMAGAGVGAMLGLILAMLAAWHSGWLAPAWVMPGLYFVLSLAHQGVRIGRKTYVVDIAGDDRRSDYVATSNSAMGVILLLVGALASLLATISLALVLAVLAALALLGIGVAWHLPEVDEA